jgi:uncharacterized OsmC-like protein
MPTACAARNTPPSLDFVIKGSGIDPDAVTRALKLSEEQICPVWNMLKGRTPITTTVQIVEAPAEVAVASVSG